MINRLTISNLKGLTKSVDLEEINLIFGPNGTGKTALIDGLKLALLGYHPRLGNKPNLTWQLASPGATMMSVATNGHSVNWKKKPNGTISVEGLPENPVPATLLDLQEWLSMAGPARIQYVIEHSGTQLSGAVEEVDNAIQLCKLESEASKIDRTDTAKFLRLLMVAAKAHKKTTQMELDVIQGSINQALLEEKAVPNNPEREIKAINKQIEEAQQKINQAVGKKKSLEAQLVLNKQATDKAKSSLEKLKTKSIDLVSDKETLARLLIEIQKLESSEKDLRDRTVNEQIKVARLRLDLDGEESKLERAKQHGTCPTCSQAISKDFVDGIQKRVDSKLINLTDAADVLDQHQNDLQFLESELEEARKEMQKLSGAIRTEEESSSQKLVAEEKLKNLKESADQFQKELAEVKEPPPVDPELITRRDALSVEAKEYAAWKGTERQRSEAIEMRTAKHEANERAKALVNTIKEAEEGLMTQVIGGLLHRANILIERVLERKLSSVDGEFMLGSANLSTVSGSEETVVFAGLQLALTPLLTDRVLVIDELHRLDQNRLEILLTAIEYLIGKKVISQFIGVVPGGKPESQISFNAIEMKGTK